ncbi:c-type cytochrome [Aquimarina sp. AU474]|uniref:c-type cytochrome n=1 Tax=Aquimarina sp. AU474 TaxID=2108529 RepID=UPI000D699B9C|nr:c-type cytochrome [Aquimarina sp. AU474]
MQKIALLLLSITLVLAGCQSEKKEKEEIVIGKKKIKQTPFDIGKKIFNGKGKCYTCHKTDKKSIGPSVIEIMKVYKEQNGNLIAFLKQEAKPIVDPETYTVMKTNFAIIKTFSQDELDALSTYMDGISNGKTE